MLGISLMITVTVDDTKLQGYADSRGLTVSVLKTTLSRTFSLIFSRL